MPGVHRRGFSSRVNTADAVAFRSSCEPRQRKRECRPAYRSRNPREGAQANGTGRHSLLGARSWCRFACSRIVGFRFAVFREATWRFCARFKLSASIYALRFRIASGILTRPAAKSSTFSRPQSRRTDRPRRQESSRNLLAARTTTNVSPGPAAVVHGNFDSRRLVLSSQKVTRQRPLRASHRTRRSNASGQCFSSNWSRRF